MSVWKAPVGKNRLKERESANEPSETQSTTASSVSKPSTAKTGVSIAKLTVLNDLELERLLRFQFKKIAAWVSQSAVNMQRVVSYRVVDKHV